MDEQVNANMVRLVTSFVVASAWFYPMLKCAKMHEIRRPNDVARSAVSLTNLATNPLETCSLSPGPNTSDLYTRAHERGKQNKTTVIERKSNLPNLNKFTTCYYIFSITFNLISGLKYMVLCLLDSNTLNRDQYGHLDCLLFGRPTINPRVVGLLKYACLCVYWFHNLYHVFMTGRKPPFRIHCLEFLLMSPAEIESYKFECGGGGGGGEYCSLLHYETTFACLSRIENEQTAAELSGGGGAKSYHARPNRSPRAWRRLAKLMTVYVGAVAAVYLIVISLLNIAILPMILTRAGFEANYHVCLKWIAEQDGSSASLSSSALWWRQQVIDVPRNYTFDPRLRRKFILSFSEQWTEFSAYHMVRVLCDTLENWIFMTQLYLALFVYLVPTLIISADVSYYARKINSAIESIISDYHGDTTTHADSGHAIREKHSSIQSSSIDDENFLWQIPSWAADATGRQSSVLMLAQTPPEYRTNARRHHYRERIAHVQAMVVDLFGLIRDYNTYTVYYVGYCTFIWYTYSFICSSWLFMPSGQHESATIESYLIQATATFVVLVILGAYSRAGRACCQLYKAISSVTSLQDADATSRDRWMVIMKHYKPVPLHCFSIFRTSELSWMFVIKLTAWLFSALFIVSSFFVGYGSNLHS